MAANGAFPRTKKQDRTGVVGLLPPPGSPFKTGACGSASGQLYRTRYVRLGVIDFGCVKVIPQDFYKGYFSLIKKELIMNEEELDAVFYNLEFINDKDTALEKEYFKQVFKSMVYLVGKPFHTESFDFADDKFFREIYELAE